MERRVAYVFLVVDDRYLLSSREQSLLDGHNTGIFPGSENVQVRSQRGGGGHLHRIIGCSHRIEC